MKVTCQYDHEFQGVRITRYMYTLESIHLNKSINCKQRIKIFTISVFYFNMLYYPISKIWFSTLEMLSLHYIMHTSCPILALRMESQTSTKKAITRPCHSWFISLIPDSWYTASICMGPLVLLVHDGMVTSENWGHIFF